jgi:elongation factor P
MRIGANSIKAGNILVYNNDLWIVSKQPEHVKPGKGPAYIQVEMKNLKTGTKLNERLNSSDYVEKAHLEQRQYQFLYFEDKNAILMDKETFEQIIVDSNIFGSGLPFLTDGMSVSIEFYEETPISATLPQTVVLEIVETEPVIKGSTVTSSYKPAILSNGVKVGVPSYIVTGEKIVVKVEDSTFVERAK